MSNPTREEVIEFAEAMESVLRDNDHKRRWQKEPLDYLYNRHVEEFEEVRVEAEALGRLEVNPITGDSAALRKELIDVANFCMMLYCRLNRASRA